MASAVEQFDSTSGRKIALITGITGQDGSYLAELLLQKNYEVHGIIRRSSSFNTSRIEHLYKDKVNHKGGDLHLHYGDTTDTTCLMKIISKIRPDEVYHLAAQSHVKVSFELSEYTANVDALGTLKLLEAIKECGLIKKTRFYQASTSELYGSTKECPQDENTPFHPRSPYGVAKLYAHWIVINYREAYDLFACNGILFNHESPRRGETFVTRKITRAVAKISLGVQDELVLGNLDAVRDWGHAQDYVKAMWLMLQQRHPDDFVIATGEAHTVREFVEHAFKHAGIEMEWSGKGLNEIGKDRCSGKTIVRVSDRYYRPAEVDRLQGFPQKAERILGWKRQIEFNEIVKEMVDADLHLMKISLAQYGSMNEQVISANQRAQGNTGRHIIISTVESIQQGQGEEFELRMEGVLFIWILILSVLQVSYGYTSTCFKGVKTTPIPSDHVYNRIKKPALIGYKGNIRNYQENTLEGMNDVIHRKFQGIHMQVQITSDEQLILFGDKNLKRLTGVDAEIRKASYNAVSKLKLQKNVKYVLQVSYGYTSTCFKGVKTTPIPSDHVYNRIKKPALIGYKGNIRNYQENTLEGMNDVIHRKFQGIHIQVQITSDEQLILFGDKNLKRLTGVDAEIRKASYNAVSKLKLQKNVKYGKETVSYKETANIRLLRDVLNNVRGKGVVIYIELVPTDAPPVAPVERYRALQMGTATGKLIRQLGLEKEVIVASSDPFKLLALNHENPNVVSSWWFKKEFYDATVAEKIRREFTDLNGLRDCYLNTAPKVIHFLPYLLETGIVTKSVNASLIDASFDIIDNPIYQNGSTTKTSMVAKKNYNPSISTGTILSYYNSEGSLDKKATNKKIRAILKTGTERLITDDVVTVFETLNSIKSNANAVNSHCYFILLNLMILFAYNTQI
eukprot:Seg1672.12 transcript_id=Seg1672.12/GoldUCD/mRNA.D3Y31 product="GDP-mannose 4 6 dehydratase" protein_id=Seg1672.12/GoldUCD/D3Y31